MLVPFLYALRAEKVPVGAQELLALADALQKEVHKHTLLGFYYVAKSLLVHSEKHLDAFDRTFAQFFHGIEIHREELANELFDWLQNATPFLDDETRKMIENMDPEELQRLFEERLKEQNERHDGGNKWIGTGGTSPFGHSGAKQMGYRIGGQGRHRSAIKVAGERKYQGYRSDQTLDIRQMSVALKRLRAFEREGQEEELDLEATVHETARNAGELEVVLRPPRRSNTRVILLMDIGGSMTPYAHLVSKLFSASSKASHFKEFRSYYFHNCIYSKIYTDENLYKPFPIARLIQECRRDYKLIIVGDALMAPYELMAPKGAIFFDHEEDRTGIEYLRELRDHFHRAIWLNPEPKKWWQNTTIESIASIFPMYNLTLDGLQDAVAYLMRQQNAPPPII